ncbi:MAG TPA: peptide-methionine (S)-S-oxide reductase MsrA [Burkholderiales bacterium]|nr:peptide-methionine (S)-S-oxide reductase MsrA [Burkholderiales bacterium]
MNKESKMSRTAKNGGWFALLALAAVGTFWNIPGRSGEAATVLPAPALDNPRGAGPAQTAVLAGGCFWGVQGVYQYTKGVKQVLSGYSGGDKSTAEYEKVGSGRTGHAESVQIVFDPREISYGEILRIYFSVAHDPTQLNRQGPDVGTQYRSEIFYADAQQKRVAEAYIAQLEKARVFRKPIVTRVEALKGFYPAEAYHQDFLLLNPGYPYIVINDLPKIANLKRLFPEQYRDKPVMTTAAAS